MRHLCPFVGRRHGSARGNPSHLPSNLFKPSKQTGPEKPKLFGAALYGFGIGNDRRGPEETG
jgi:hypothetical protein